ncbi:hypothetical protein BOTBODRAFT_38821 [Botryobasidium botryosum FD-172 SS1]|uniref:Uncharacterized protein n=1 Tax=Botryobasidium botryosum (strain FD-172 SS1) TaxID=930990 RepID=A0A067M6D2_BOTB1|nr:hypothetical protein BOTBODRAFT_38821 [Botryobasidium botryosum FD-172 SS1]
MFPTRAALSKASRLPLTPKHGNKDYYKGNRAAYLPGGHRTGAPGKFVIGGKAKYRIIDEKVRYFVAPPISEIENSPLKAYVHTGAKMSNDQKKELYGDMPRGGFDGKHYLQLVRDGIIPEGFVESPEPSPSGSSSPST